MSMSAFDSGFFTTAPAYCDEVEGKSTFAVPYIRLCQVLTYSAVSSSGRRRITLARRPRNEARDEGQDWFVYEFFLL